MSSITECVECGKPATHFTAQDAPYDPVCDKHYDERFCHCPNCNAEVEISDVGYVETRRATMLSPAEGIEVCSECCGDDRDAEDDAYDRWRDREIMGRD